MFRNVFMGTERKLAQLYMSSISLSICVFIILSGFSYSLISQIVQRVMSFFTIAIMAAEGKFYNYETNNLDLFNAISRVLSQKSLSYYLTTFLLFFLMLTAPLLIVKNWKEIRFFVTTFPKQYLSLVPKAFHNIHLYLGLSTISYGIIKLRLIIGLDFFKLSSVEKKDFLLFHELFHLRCRDTLVKNIILNSIIFITPISILLHLHNSLLILDNLDFFKSKIVNQIVVTILSGVPIFLIYIFSRRIISFFSIYKEHLCDKYSYFSTGYLPDFPKTNDRHHPKAERRKSFLSAHETGLISATNFLLFIFISCFFINNVVLVLSVVGVAQIFLLVDLFNFKLIFFNLRDTLPLIIIFTALLLHNYLLAYSLDINNILPYDIRTFDTVSYGNQIIIKYFCIKYITISVPFIFSLFLLSRRQDALR